MNANIFGANLRQLRRQSHLTQRQLGHRLGVSDKAISRWEGGDTAPDLDTLQLIAAVFGVSTDRLLGIKPLPLMPVLPVPPAPAWHAPTPAGRSGSQVTTAASQAMLAELLQMKNEYGSQDWDALTAETLFGDTNYFHFLPRDQRGEILFTLGVGWNAPFWAKADSNQLAEIDPDPEKFGALGDTPLQRLRGLVERTREYGYSGLGLELWMHSHTTSNNAQRPLWEERARRCQQAGVALLKITYTVEWDESFSQMITEVMSRCAPDVELELSTPWQRYLSRADSQAIADRRRQYSRLLPVSDAVMVTDAFEPFATVSALRNADLALSCGATPQNGRRGLLNFGNQVYAGAVLGGTLTVSRPGWESEAALGWQRLSPPFGVHTATYHRSAEELMDSHRFYRNVERPQLEGHTLRHTAPAVMSRGCPLPTVTVREGITPYVAASRNPLTDAYALGSFRRNVHPNTGLWGLADVTLSVDSTTVPVGLFGLFASVTLVYPHPLSEEIRITVQDPAGHLAPLDVTREVTRQGNTLHLDGNRLGYWGKRARTQDSDDDPSLILRIE